MVKKKIVLEATGTYLVREAAIQRGRGKEHNTIDYVTEWKVGRRLHEQRQGTADAILGNQGKAVWDREQVTCIVFPS